MHDSIWKHRRSILLAKILDDFNFGQTWCPKITRPKYLQYNHENI